MPRSGKEARARLETSALELVAARGFDSVTVTEIAEHAGVTERTFFRHFPDKREVLFNGERLLQEWFIAALAEIPPTESPLETLHLAFRTLAPKIEGNRGHSEPLGRIIAETPSLSERAAAKEARLVTLVTASLVDRGIDAGRAAVAARTAWGLLSHATASWQADPSIGLVAHIDQAFSVLGELTAELKT